MISPLLVALIPLNQYWNTIIIPQARQGANHRTMNELLTRKNTMKIYDIYCILLSQTWALQQVSHKITISLTTLVLMLVEQSV